MKCGHALTLGWLFLGSVASGARAAIQERVLPAWFEANRVQAHYENGIEEDLDGMYRDLHAAVGSMGARVLTRIFKTTGEGAWWPTTVGRSHDALAGRDLGREIADDARGRGLKVFAYYRIMCDDLIEQEHPEWLCRDAEGKLVVEPRTRKRAKPTHVICFNSSARSFTQTRLLELADRGVDGIYFDSWHMPEICACANCRAAFEKETGEPMDASAAQGSAAYRRASAFVGRTIVRTFTGWMAAVKEKHPGVVFAIGSSLYPCFDTQMQITSDLLRISDTSKTEFSKPFGGHLRSPAAAGVEGGGGGGGKQGFMDASYAIPDYDVQNALGWTFTRDSCDGRPPLMWIPFTRTEEEALFSVAAAVSYGCVASLHPEGLRERRSPIVRSEALRVYEPCYGLGNKVSPVLAGTRPVRDALIHVSGASRDTRIGDQGRLWVELIAPILGAFEAMKEAHLPVATINDTQLEEGVPRETRVLFLPGESDCSEAQRASVRRFEDAGGRVIRLYPGAGWHLKAEKDRLKRELIAGVQGQGEVPPMRALGPAGMHAVFYRDNDTRRTVVCLVNAFGWFRSSREGSSEKEKGSAPAPCSGVSIEIGGAQGAVGRVFEAATGKELVPNAVGGRMTVSVPEFPVMACVVIEESGATKGTR